MHHPIRVYRLFLFLILTQFIFAQTLPEYVGRESLLNRSQNGTERNLPDFGVTGVIDEASYIVGPGDVLFVSMMGVSDKSFELPVNPEGKVFIPKVGMISLYGKTLEESKEDILETLEKEFSGVSIDISLSFVRNIKIDVTGYLAAPSSYIVPANARLSDLLKKVGQLPADCDLRNIKITDVNNKSRLTDLIRFNRLGDEANNPYLMDVKSVNLKKNDRLVYVLGAVNYPGGYEFVQNESFASLLELAGGVLEKASEDSVEVITFLDDHFTQVSSYYKLAEIKSDQSIIAKSHDRLIIRAIPDFLIDRLVTVEGEVLFPGQYKIEKGKTTLYELLVNEVGGFKEDASLTDAYVQRKTNSERPDLELERIKKIPPADMTEDEYEYLKARSRERKGRMTVDFEKLFVDKDMSENLVLKRGDLIHVPEKTDYITVVGQVLSPGNVVYNKSYTVEDYIRLTGGFAWRAIDDDVRVIKSLTGEWMEADEVEELNPGDIVWVPEEAPPAKFWDVFRDVVFVVGQASALLASVVAIIVATR